MRREVRESGQVMECRQGPCGEEWVRPLPAAQAAEVYEAVASIERAEAQGESNQAAMERLMRVAGEPEEGFGGERCACCEGCGPVLPARGDAAQGAARNRPCPCGSGRKYKKCCGRGR